MDARVGAITALLACELIHPHLRDDIRLAITDALRDAERAAIRRTWAEAAAELEGRAVKMPKALTERRLLLEVAAALRERAEG